MIMLCNIVNDSNVYRDMQYIVINIFVIYDTNYSISWQLYLIMIKEGVDEICRIAALT